MKEYFTLKPNDTDINEIQNLSPAIVAVFSYLCLYADTYGLPVRITSIFERIPERVSSTHSTGRAIDISVDGWSDLHLERLKNKLNRDFKKWGTSKDGKNPKVMIIHDVGLGKHIHIQTRRGITYGEE